MGALFLVQGLYLLATPWFWLLLLSLQFLLCLLALFRPSWRFFGSLCLGWLVFSNASWLLDSAAPQCLGPVTLSGYAKERPLPGAGHLDFLRPQIDCDGHRHQLAWARITWPQEERLGGWFLEGDRLEIRLDKFDPAGYWGGYLDSQTSPKASNLSRQAAIENRSWLLLYLQAKARYYLSPSAYSYLKALATADRSSLGRDQKRIFRELGIAHLLAISGMHTGIIFLWVNFICRFLLSLPHHWVEDGRVLAWADGLSLGLVWAYLLMIGLPVSAERAWMMVAWWALLKHFYHRQPLWLILGGVGQMILLSEPWAIAQLSFQLSFLSVAGILLIAPYLPRPGRRRSWAQNFKLMAWSSLAISAWLFVFNLVVLERIIHQHSVLSPLNNLVHISAVAWVVLPSYLLALGWSLLGAPFGGLWGEAWLYGWANLVSKGWHQSLVLNDQLNQYFLFSLDLGWSAGARLAVLGLLVAGVYGLNRRFTRRNA
ncbi:MAG: ComEC/Rec2 family competence protein [bacterium]|nr:ComEC/Rec2 family competence protein [bacterium]